MPPLTFEDKYQLIDRIGQGAQSVVFSAICKQTRRSVAVKEIKGQNLHQSDGQELIPVSRLAVNFREIAVLQRLGSHSNLVELIEVIFDEKSLYIVMDHCGINLSEYIVCQTRLRPAGIPLKRIQAIAIQILSGLAFVHSNLVIHRDIKPNNIFVSSPLNIKIGDFGLSKAFTFPPAPETLNVASLWYRSPEAILKCGYDVGLDLWSVGCVIAELAIGIPLFLESSEFGLLMRIFQTLGTPSKKVWPVLSKATNYSDLWPQWSPEERLASFRQFLQGKLGFHGSDLIIAFLQFDSNSRPRCKEALSHAFFQNFHEPPLLNKQIFSGTSLPEDLYASV